MTDEARARPSARPHRHRHTRLEVPARRTPLPPRGPSSDRHGRSDNARRRSRRTKARLLARVAGVSVRAGARARLRGKAWTRGAWATPVDSLSSGKSDRRQAYQGAASEPRTGYKTTLVPRSARPRSPTKQRAPRKFDPALGLSSPSPGAFARLPTGTSGRVSASLRPRGRRLPRAPRRGAGSRRFARSGSRAE